MTVAVATIRATWRSRAIDALEPVGIAALAGAIAGFLVAGLGGRMAMRIAGAMSDASLVGVARTENGNIVGEITFGGTAFLVIAFTLEGLAVGLLFALVRPWLAQLGRWAGVVFGLAGLAALGEIVLDPVNFDFRKFGSPALNVALFALLFPLFGLVLGVTLSRIERGVRGAPRLSPWRIAVALTELVVLVGASLLVVAVAVRVVSGAVDLAFTGDGRGLIFPIWLILALGGRALVRGSHDARMLPTLPRLAMSTALLFPAVLGAPRLITGIAFLVRP